MHILHLLTQTGEKHSQVDEFASDALTISTSTEDQVIDRYSIANELEQLGVTASDVAEDWDENLARELEDLGLEHHDDGGHIESDQQWEEEIERILDTHSDT